MKTFKQMIAENFSLAEEKVKHYGKTYDAKVFMSDKAANDFMEKNDGWGVLFTKGKKVYVAHEKDLGEAKKLDPVGKEDDDIDNDGDVDSSDRYLKNRRKAISKAMDEESLDELSDKTLASYAGKSAKDFEKRKKNLGAKGQLRKAQRRKQGIDRAVGKMQKRRFGEEYTHLEESYKAGTLKLKDGSSVKLSSDDAKKLNTLMGDLEPSNKTKMEKTLMLNKKSFEEVLSFAKEVD